MGSQTPTGSDRSRTYWTPPMERYFLDLMLDQMAKGNRIGHTFNKQAWIEMLTVFNAKFGSQYDKDVLKNRYTNLWKQFNDIKMLLDQNGFSWDKTLQMVTADDYVWESYLKVHPDARPYKTKTVLNYEDLCIIYGYTVADGRYSRSSHDVDFEDDVPGVNLDGMGSQTPATIERSRTDWTPLMDQYFVDLMLDQVQRGNKIDNTFNKQAWTDMLASFNARFGSQHGKRVLRHRYKKLWKYYSDVMVLLDQNGFSWDESQQMITANDEIWDAYIKVHPHARPYRTKILPNYGDLAIIYRNVISDGRCNHLSRDKDLEVDMFGTDTGDGMEIQIPTSSERSRTYWTPPMDRYLIDLLLNQVHKGNKIGQTFISQSWIYMVSMFNEKFNSQYDKDVLKNRYKHLRRQYNDIKILLEQSGFSWDGTREMVTAEDSVWDAYTRAHPDARSYRVKTIPCYDKLCVIYGKEGSDGRYSRLARNIDIDDEIPCVNIGEGKDSQPPVIVDRSRTDWTPSMDRYFIDLMLEQVDKGNKFENTFNKQAWTDMIAMFNARFGSIHDKDVLRSRHKNLRKQYNDIKILLGQSGFSWDETRQMVTANDDVWDSYIKEHPDARSYRTKTKPDYKDLCVIYGSSDTDGGRHLSCQDIDADYDVIGVKNEGRDGQAPTSNDRPRTEWTPPMDRYFIDLMIEQVHRGNMIDHRFSKQAWSSMVTMFCAKFGSQHDKDVLRSRFKNLRKRYNDMKILLDQNDFAWDETRQMITASDDVWDAYIKAHPDARSYRTKTVPNYNDLSLIYGDIIANGRLNDWDHLIEIDNDILEVNIGVEDQSPANCATWTDWTPEMERCFIDLMLEQVHQGNMSGCTFNEQAWTHMITAFNEKFGLQYGKHFLEMQSGILSKQCNDIINLLKQNGFAWDETHHTVVAENDVWDAYIKEHPDALSYRSRSLVNYTDLCIIFGSGNSDGSFGSLGEDTNLDREKMEMKISGDLQSPFMSACSRDLVNDVPESLHSRGDMARSNTSSKRGSVKSACQQPKKVQRTNEAMVGALSKMTDVVASLENSRENTNSTSIERVIDALQAVPDIDDDLLLDACDLLEDDKKAKTFLALDVSIRKKWLLRKLRQQQAL